MARPNKFFSFALLLSLIAFSSTSFLTADNNEQPNILSNEQPNILSKEEDNQSDLNGTTEDENKDEKSGSWLPNLPKMTESRAGAARACIPLLAGYFLPPVADPYGKIAVQAAQASCAALTVSAITSNKFILKAGIKLPILIATIAGSLYFDSRINILAERGATYAPALGAFLVTGTSSDGELAATPLFNVGKVVVLIAGANMASPYLSKAIKAAGKKLGYIQKSKKNHVED